MAYDLEVDDFVTEVVSHLGASQEEFCRFYDHPFFLRRPKTLFTHDSGAPDSGPIEYQTSTIEKDSDGLMPWQWWLRPVIKRPENPFPDRLSLGRAPNSDVVLRFPFISKLHARVHLSRDDFELEDCNSSNGTFIHGSRLKPQERVSLASGDRVIFGTLQLEFLSAASCYQILRARRQSLASPSF